MNIKINLIFFSLLSIGWCQVNVRFGDGYGMAVVETEQDELDSGEIVISIGTGFQQNEEDSIGLGENLGPDDDCDAVIDKVFSNFAVKYTKKYDCEEHAAAAKKNILDNLKAIRDHNARHAAGEFDYSMALYKFHDVETEQAFKFLSGTRLPATPRALPVDEAPDVSVYPDGPDSVNFTDSCLPIVDQGQCGACWSFAATAQVECLFKKNDPAYATHLSQQYLIDCSTKNKGCRGGWPRSAMEYLRDHGIVKNRTYPYKAEKETCENTRKLGQVPNLSAVYSYKLNGNETLMKNIVAAVGPVAAVVHASKKFLGYKKGIFSDPDCATSCGKMTHGVVVVGYGTDEETGKDFWIVRNSYGDDWGENGYMRLARNHDNSCLVACYAMFSEISV